MGLATIKHSNVAWWLRVSGAPSTSCRLFGVCLCPRSVCPSPCLTAVGGTICDRVWNQSSRPWTHAHLFLDTPDFYLKPQVLSVLVLWFSPLASYSQTPSSTVGEGTKHQMLFLVWAVLSPLGLCKKKDPEMDPRGLREKSRDICVGLVTRTAQQGEITCIVYIHLFIQNFCLDTIQAYTFLQVCFLKFIYIFTVICTCISSFVISYNCSLPLNLLRMSF